MKRKEDDQPSFLFAFLLSFFKRTEKSTPAANNATLKKSINTKMLRSTW